MWNTIFGCSFVLALSVVLTPAAERIAWQIGAVDIPRDRRRMHHRAIARSGGIAIYVSFLLGCLLFCDPHPFLTRTMIGASLIFLMGLWDDVTALPPWIKLAVQLLAAGIGCGLSMQPVTLVSILWVVLLSNAHNFIDGLDGLFAGCATVECVALSGMLLMTGQGSWGLPVLMIGISCLGFRSFNRHPARIFAGDCGSETVGYCLGMFSLLLFYEMRWSAGWLAPIFLFAYPLVDLISSVLRRLINGRSPFFADRAHLHHRICATGVGQVNCGRILIFLCSVFCTVGLSLCTGQFLFTAGIACLLAAALLVEIQAFFYSV